MANDCLHVLCKLQPYSGTQGISQPAFLGGQLLGHSIVAFCRSLNFSFCLAQGFGDMLAQVHRARQRRRLLQDVSGVVSQSIPFIHTYIHSPLIHFSASFFVSSVASQTLLPCFCMVTALDNGRELPSPSAYASLPTPSKHPPCVYSRKGTFAGTYFPAWSPRVVLTRLCTHADWHKHASACDPAEHI